MIHYVVREELDEVKYNECIEASIQSRVYAYSWYLDIVVDQWDILVLNDYEAVMPIPLRRKYFIHYVYPPLWILELGVYSKIKNNNEADFLSFLQKKFLFIELRLNSGNKLDTRNSFLKERQFQELDLTQGHDSIRNRYQSDRKKDVKRAEKHQLRIEWGSHSDELIQLFRSNVGTRTPEIKDKDYKNLKTLISTCEEKNVGETCSVYQKNQLLAAAFVLKHQTTVTILCSSTDFSNRKNGANTFLIDQAIQRFSKDYSVFNFGGSSIKSIAKYFVSFGAKQKTYPMLVKKPKLFLT